MKEITVTVGKSLQKQKNDVLKKEGQNASKFIMNYVQCLNKIGESEVAATLQQTFN